MIGLDTNVLIRYVMQDDAKQSALANRLIDSLTVESPGYVALVSVVEIAWVLCSAYDLDRAQLMQAFEGLLRTKELVIENAETVWKAVRSFQSSNADFADCLIERAAAVAGCEKTMTFDRAAAKSGGMTLLA
jgi:predicted nucleic-acid-binding protein